jgi:hypothetical protein
MSSSESVTKIAKRQPTRHRPMPMKRAIMAHIGTACRPCSISAAKLSMPLPMASNVLASWSSR